MRIAVIRRFLSLLLVIVVLGGYTSVYAQGEPPTKPTASRQDPNATPEPTITPSDDSSTLNDDSGNEASSPEALPVEDQFEQSPDATTVPLDENDQTRAAVPRLQGAISFDVSSPTGGTRAGDYITYTYSYTNTTSSPVNDVVVQAWWTNFSANENGGKQFCTSTITPSNCGVDTNSWGNSPVVTKITCPAGVSPSDSYCYSIGSLGAGQSGRFSVRLKTQTSLYPKTNQAITSLAGSGKLLRNTSPVTIVSDDTTNTLIVGPVLVAKKTAVTIGKIYTGDVGTFQIVVGNATGTNDKPNNIVRADARPATKIVVIDVIPVGSEFASATPAPTSTSPTEVRWEFNSQTLAPGASLPDIQVSFRKLGGETNLGSCGKLNNSSVKLTSAEYPANTLVNFNGASIPVVVPMQINSVIATPGTLYFGDTGEIEITVQNYSTSPVTGAKLSYLVQSNASHVVGNSRPVATTSSTTLVEWVFNMPAGKIDVPTTATFTLGIVGSFTKAVAAGTGRAALTPPAPIASSCPTREGRASLTERLSIEKFSLEEGDKEGPVFLVKWNQEFEYQVEVENNGSTPATNVEVLDVAPSNSGAQFALASVPTMEPALGINPEITSVNGVLQSMRWVGVPVAPLSKVTITYKVRVIGFNYARYCNNASAKSYRGVNNAEEELVKTGSRGAAVCVKISPDVLLTKAVGLPGNKPVTINIGGNTPLPQRTVTFTITMTNQEPVQAGQPELRLSFYDTMATALAGKTLNFLAIVSQKINNQPADFGLVWDATRKILSGPANRIMATGDVYQVIFTAEVPDACIAGSYVNKLWFRDDLDESPIVPNPVVEVRVPVSCGQVEYSISADRNPISLLDSIVYTVRLDNKDSRQANNVSVETRMPENFTFVTMEANSSISTAPTQVVSGTFTTLRWPVPKVVQGTPVVIKFRARSGLTILSGAKPIDGALVTLLTGGVCRGTCVIDPNSGLLYSSHLTKVEPLAYIQPSILESGCAEPNSTRTYEVVVVNANTHAYLNTEIVVRLPPGLTFVRALDTTEVPVVSQSGKDQLLSWSNQTIPVKASGQQQTQKSYKVQLAVSNKGFGGLRVQVQASSPDGGLPRKEGVGEPTVYVCLAKPTLYLGADKFLIKPGETTALIMQAVNPSSSPFVVSLAFTIPDGFTYVEPTDTTNSLTPVVAGNVLTWENVNVPAASGTSYGVVEYSFKLTLAADASIGSKYNSALRLTARQPANLNIDDTSNTAVSWAVAKNVFLPLMRRT